MEKIIAVMTAMLLFGVNGWATPPSILEIDYIKEEGKLYVYMDHLSRDHTRHYIRKVSIMKNGEEVATKTNRQQVDPNHYAFSIDVQAAANDEITVTTFCSEGGKKSTSIVVPKDEKENKEAKPSDIKAKVEGLKDKEEQAPVYSSKGEVFQDKADVYENKEDMMKRKGGY
ncbi:MAG TPA: hypothetical protein VI749_05805 [Candidatus Omnitrophota bacterium]|nr:hypothetical protein [Candidatus Omnitrophota bacterium]